MNFTPLDFNQTQRPPQRSLVLALVLLLLALCLPSRADHAAGVRIPSGTASGQIVVWDATANGGTGGYVLNPLLGFQAPNTFLAGPASGAAGLPGFRQMVSADLPVPMTLTATGPGVTPLTITSASNASADIVRITALPTGNVFRISNFGDVSSPGNLSCGSLSVGGQGVGARFFGDDPNGVFSGFYAGYNGARWTLGSNNASQIAFVIKLPSGQTADARQTQTSTGTVIENLTPAGIENAQGFSTAGTAGYTGTIPLNAQSLDVKGGILVGYHDSTGAVVGN